MLENEKLLNEIEDDDLAEIAGGGTYTKDGYLKTTISYSCGNFKCKECGKDGSHEHMGLTRGGSTSYTVSKCRDCQWHSALRCGNPINRR